MALFQGINQWGGTPTQNLVLSSNAIGYQAIWIVAPKDGAQLTLPAVSPVGSKIGVGYTLYLIDTGNYITAAGDGIEVYPSGQDAGYKINGSNFVTISPDSANNVFQISYQGAGRWMLVGGGVGGGGGAGGAAVIIQDADKLCGSMGASEIVCPLIIPFIHFKPKLLCRFRHELPWPPCARPAGYMGV